MRNETLWFIVGRYGLYYGGRGTRRAAISEHVNAVDEDCYHAAHSAWNSLSDLQRKAWKKCKKNGDRAVKATVAWEAADG